MDQQQKTLAIILQETEYDIIADMLFIVCKGHCKGNILSVCAYLYA